MAGPEPAGLSAGRREALYRQTLDCVHCGLCLSACPTYRETGRETSSPRGRVYLMRGVAEGRLPLEAAAEEMDLCLGCRACETACPSGVQYGAMLETMRAEVAEAGLRRGPGPRLERLALRGLVAHPRRLHRAFDLLALAQRLRLDRLARPLLPRRLRVMQEAAPRVPPRAERAWPAALLPAEGARRGRVGFLVGCVMPELFGRVNAATCRVLQRNGFEVVVPREQGCCGALHAHAGDTGFANDLARRNAAAFAAAGVDFVVTNSAGCGAALREAGRWIPGEGEALAAAARDVCELLDQAGLRGPLRPLRLRVCYDDPCHLVHGQRVELQPRRLLQQIPGLDLVPHDDPTSCCGAAGTYGLTHPEMSGAVLARKLRALAAADPDVIASGNPGCMLQLASGIARAGMRQRVVHPIELLDEASAGAGS